MMKAKNILLALLVIATVGILLNYAVGLFDHSAAQDIPQRICPTISWEGVDFEVDPVCPLRRVLRAETPDGWIVVICAGGGPEISAVYLPDKNHRWLAKER